MDELLAGNSENKPEKPIKKSRKTPCVQKQKATAGRPTDSTVMAPDVTPAVGMWVIVKYQFPKHLFKHFVGRIDEHRPKTDQHDE